jgi:hypothetical protein
MPIVLNQDNVVLDGHHRLRACKELGIPVSYSIKDFTGKPLDELKIRRLCPLMLAVFSQSFSGQKQLSPQEPEQAQQLAEDLAILFYH